MFNFIPNIPNLIGKGLGNVLHAPVDLVRGVKEGFMSNENTEKTEDEVKDTTEKAEKSKSKKAVDSKSDNI